MFWSFDVSDVSGQQGGNAVGAPRLALFDPDGEDTRGLTPAGSPGAPATVPDLIEA